MKSLIRDVLFPSAAALGLLARRCRRHGRGRRSADRAAGRR